VTTLFELQPAVNRSAKVATKDKARFNIRKQTEESFTVFSELRAL
jgi:hypothetical protein